MKQAVGVVFILALCLVVALVLETGPAGALPSESSQQETAPVTATPDDTTFPHRDPVEADAEAREVSSQARTLIINGSLDQAETLLKSVFTDFPNSRSVNRLLAEIYWIRYKDQGGGREALLAATLYAQAGFEAALNSGLIDSRLSSILSEGLAALGDVQKLDALYTRAIAIDQSFASHVDYAQGLALLGDARAEEHFVSALVIASGQGASMSVVEPYGEWLLDQRRYQEVLSLKPEDGTANPYLHFLRGIALEGLGRALEARQEYDKYSAFSNSYPAPLRFRIEGSESQAQSGIQFENPRPPDMRQSRLKIFPSQAQKGLSFLIFGEAGAESIGAMRAAGWTVRNRVLRGTVFPVGGGDACPDVENQGSTFGDRYLAVMCQGGGAQFNGVCLAWCNDPETGTCDDSSVTTEVAKDVYYGHAPDPVGKHCPGGFQTYGDWCDPTTKCRGGNKDSYRIRGALFFRSPPEPCESHFCAPQSWGAICGNGGSENCFFSNPAYVAGSIPPVAGSITGTTCWLNSSSGVSSPVGIHKAHLEGPEDSSNPDFKLEFQRLLSGSWTTLATSNRRGTVEDVEFNASAGTYRWRVCPVSGTGAFALYVKRP